MIYGLWVLLMLSLQTGTDAYRSQMHLLTRHRHLHKTCLHQTTTTTTTSVQSATKPTEVVNNTYTTQDRDRRDKLRDFFKLVETGQWSIASNYSITSDMIHQHMKFFINLHDLQKLQLQIPSISSNQTILFDSIHFISTLKTVASQVNPTLQRHLPLAAIMSPILQETLPYIMQEKNATSDIIWSLGRLGFDCHSNQALVKTFIENFLKDPTDSFTAASLTRGIMGLVKLHVTYELLDDSIQDAMFDAIVALAGEFNDRETANLIYS